MGSNGSKTFSGRQRGATAVEFALVFPVFFLLFYGLLTYGLIFLMRMGLQHAAEDGARAALHYPVGSCDTAMGRICDAAEQKQYQFNARLSAAYATALRQASWMDFRPDQQPLQVTSRICLVGQDCVGAALVLSCNGPDCASATLPPACGSDFLNSCQIMVTVSYDYANAPFIPTLPGMGLLTPANLTGQARLLLDGRALSS